MLLALFAAVLLKAPEPAPTLGSIRSLSPRAFGNVVLRGRDHGIVDKVEPLANNALEVPGGVTLELTERPRAITSGCVRQQWRANFTRRSEPPKAQRYSTTLLLQPKWLCDQRPLVQKPASRM